MLTWLIGGGLAFFVLATLGLGLYLRWIDDYLSQEAPHIDVEITSVEDLPEPGSPEWWNCNEDTGICLGGPPKRL